MWIDAHCHLSETEPSLCEAQLARARALGIGGWILGGMSPAEWERQTALQARVGTEVFLCFGLHPWWVASATDAQIAVGLGALEAAAPGAALIGEMGLDHLEDYSGPGARERQLRVFQSLLHLANRHSKPVVLHAVQSHGAVLDVLRACPPERGGIVHGFSGSVETARAYAGLGCLVSVGGGVLKNFAKLRAAIPLIPPEALVIETDTLEPSALIAIADAVAGLRNETRGAVLDRSTHSLQKLLGIR